MANEDEILKLRKALEDAAELAEEAMSYVSPTFREKWDMDERLSEVKRALDNR